MPRRSGDKAAHPAAEALRRRYQQHVAEEHARKKREEDERRASLQPLVNKVFADIVALAEECVNDGSMVYNFPPEHHGDTMFIEMLASRLRDDGFHLRSNIFSEPPAYTHIGMEISWH